MDNLERYKELNQRAEKLKELESNWDTYNALPMDHALIKKAQNYLLLLARRGVLPPDSVVPMCNGGVQVQWRAEDFAVEFEPPHQYNGNKQTTTVLFEISSKEDMELATQLLSVLSNMQLDDIVEGVH